jgi:epoxyqueuosine reductase
MNNNLKEELRAKSKQLGFQLFGVADIAKMEEVPFPGDRGLQKPSEVMSSAKSLIVMGMVIWDEGMNVSVSTAGSGDFSGGDTEYYNLYYLIVET